jgi:hypothetical protein
MVTVLRNREKYSLFRSEFIELIVRIAYNKYMHGRRPATKVWAEAVSMLFRDHLACDSLTHIEITLDRDEFRRQRLYRKVRPLSTLCPPRPPQHAMPWLVRGTFLCHAFRHFFLPW